MPTEQIPVPVMSLVPLIHSSNTQKSSVLQKHSSLLSANEQPFVKKHSQSTFLNSQPTILPNLKNNEKFEFDNDRAFGVSSATTSDVNNFDNKILSQIINDKLVNFSPFTKQLNLETPTILATTLTPLTIRVSYYYIFK